MLYLCLSRKETASLYIQTFHLKKETAHHKFSIYKNDSYTLIISLKGPIQQAIAITYLFDHYPMRSGDHFISIENGTCCDASMDRSVPYIISKITHIDEKITYYPDLLIKHPFTEATLTSSATMLPQTDTSASIFDQLSAAIYESALNFCNVDQIIFIRILSDSLKIHQPILDFLLSLQQQTYQMDPVTFTISESSKIDEIISELHLTESQRQKLLHSLYYAKLKKQDLLSDLTTFITNYQNHGCHSKKEGKYYLEQLLNSICSL
ncbi:spore photoproduct lyase [Lachnospiraceae bacterium KM106-2]|nr:spore photoproduct lyase [Lachnospiraceae bacterium KM106-2]